MKNILYTIILSFLFSSAVSAEIYKWVDDEGKVHYGEKLPDNTKGKSIENIKTKDSVSADIQASEDAYEAGDYEAAFILIKLLAEQGDPWAQYKIGQMYDEGKGVTQDYKEAVKWYHLAAEQGDADAQNSLGYMYQNGEGVTKDYKEAEKWYRLATKQGDAGAQFNLGVMYQAGYGVTKDYQEALKWFRLAAEQGLAESQSYLGQMYYKGLGVIKDIVLAHMWWNISANDGNKWVSGYQKGKENRDVIKGRMTSEQMAEAQNLARECVKKNYKDCG